MSDAEGSRAADGGAPPWHGATWTARMRSAVSEIRCKTKTSDPIMERGRTQLTSSVGHESKCWLWFYSVLSLALALPQV